MNRIPMSCHADEQRVRPKAMRRIKRKRVLLGLLLSSISNKSVNCFTTLQFRRRPIDKPFQNLAHWESCPLFASKENNKGDKEADQNPFKASSPRNNGTKKKWGGKADRKFATSSRNKAFSALSQPSSTADDKGPKDRAISKLSKLSDKNDDGNKKDDRTKIDKKMSRDDVFPNTGVGFRKERQSGKRGGNQSNSTKTDDPDGSFYSLLPPPMKGLPSGSSGAGKDSLITDGLSSWEDFLGGGGGGSNSDPSQSSKIPAKIEDESRPRSSGRHMKSKSDARENLKPKGSVGRNVEKQSDNTDRLPSIADLFPPGLSKSILSNEDDSIDDDDEMDIPGDSAVVPPPPALNGVLPVSDLFYRSAQSMDDEDNIPHDDEELPFSAEQSNQLATGNKIKVRRNQAKAMPSRTPRTIKRNRRPSAPSKMVRRGMEMLVGGVPINADPPQRYFDLMYTHQQHQKVNWHEVISTNSRDFGPMLHGSSVGLVTKIEQGLFCEHFVHNALKWDVCPSDLKALAKEFSSFSAGEKIDSSSAEAIVDSILEDASLISSNNSGSVQVGQESDYATRENDSTDTSAPSFGTITSFANRPPADLDHDESDLQPHLGGELVFSIGISPEELESGDSPSDVPVLERVLARGITASTECSGFFITFTKLSLSHLDDGATMISGEFKLNLKDKESMSFREMDKKAHRINSALAVAMEDGDMQLAMAAAAREETGWPETVRDRVVEEFLFDDDDGDLPWEEDETSSDDDSVTALAKSDDEDCDASISRREKSLLDALPNAKKSEEEYDGPFGMPGSIEYHKDDIFLGGGNDGVFWDYSVGNAKNAPYGGELGLRLVDAVVERAKERKPRVIAIGDVHGCIDELQDLLRQCDYRPGDTVVFLGDLVSKGPDSIAVVQMAREIGAIGIRGNHDFEVIRWHQAIKSGVDPPVVGSEHYHIASVLSDADMKWMYSLPWYISSRELGALFVHAGFVSGIRLAKQNPRLMMNMRSILPDGTVTSKFFNNWPWARLWDGPQTVLFGHDADRGLQQYENAIGLDTGCVYGGRLTACILPEKRLVSVSARREYFKYRRKHYD